MNAENRFPFHYGMEAEQYAFYRIPKALFEQPEFKDVSTDAKLLYGMMLDRMALSCKNGWIDEQGRVFIYFTVASMCECFQCSADKCTKMLSELDTNKGIGLIHRVRQGFGKPDMIYVKHFLSSSGYQTPLSSGLLTPEKTVSGGRKKRDPETGFSGTNNTEINNTEINKTEKREQRHQYGRYHNVLLSDTDMEKLKVEFPADYQERIERVSEYMASTGKSYKDYLATIRRWARQDQKKKQPVKGGIDYSYEEGDCV